MLTRVITTVVRQSGRAAQSSACWLVSFMPLARRFRATRSGSQTPRRAAAAQAARQPPGPPPRAEAARGQPDHGCMGPNPPAARRERRSGGPPPRPPAAGGPAPERRPPVRGRPDLRTARRPPRRRRGATRRRTRRGARRATCRSRTSGSSKFCLLFDFGVHDSVLVIDFFTTGARGICSGASCCGDATNLAARGRER